MSPTRQPAAIMFTDIAGYTALKGEDEQKAFEIHRKNRQLQKTLIQQYNGKWIKEFGDGELASFHTITDAVLYSMQIQKGCNQNRPFNLRCVFHFVKLYLKLMMCLVIG